MTKSKTKANIIGNGDAAPRFEANAAWGRSFDVNRVLKSQKLALIFLRYIGCPVCQMRYGKLIKEYEIFKEAGVEVAVVLESTAENIEKYGKDEVPFFVLPDIERR